MIKGSWQSISFFQNFLKVKFTPSHYKKVGRKKKQGGIDNLLPVVIGWKNFGPRFFQFSGGDDVNTEKSELQDVMIIVNSESRTMRL